MTQRSAWVSTLSIALLTAPPLWAQSSVGNYPEKAIRVIVSSPPGSGADLMMRRLTPIFAKKLGEPFIVDNRPGAAGGLGLGALSQAAPDGYTVGPLIAQNVAAMVTKTITLDVSNALSPVAIMVSQPYILLGSPDLPAGSVKELVALAKTKKLAYASSGFGSIVHLGMEMLTHKTGTTMLHVPYKGSKDMLTDLMSDRVQAAIINSLSAKPFVTSKKVKALAVTSSSRTNVMPDVPTVAESGVPGYELLSWYGLAAPKGTPDALIQKLNLAVTQVLNTPEVKSRFAADGADVAPPNKPAALSALILKEKAQWEALVKSGIKLR